MSVLNLKALIRKLSRSSRQALEDAVGLAYSRGHYDVELEHLLQKLLDASSCDLAAIIRHYGIDESRLRSQLSVSLSNLRTGNGRPPGLSPHLVALLREAWVLASVEHESECAGSGHMLCALLTDETLARVAREISSELGRLQGDALLRDLPTIVAAGVEMGSILGPGSVGSAPVQGSQRGGGALDQYTVDLTELARQGAIDPVLGRDDEVRQIVDILSRRRQNNPILTGEAGVGKTAVVEGFALRIAAGEVPDALRTVTLRSLDLAMLQAGASVRGEFENRLKTVIQEVNSSAAPVILFIDEAHTLIGAGGAAGQGDAANLLKPALARGELRTIAATTWGEYKKYFERDAALARRFQVVAIDEPEPNVAAEMLRGIVEKLETHHGVRVLDEAVREAVRLSQRYISGRQLPDKAVGVLDTACANVAMSHRMTPMEIERVRRRMESLATRIRTLEREGRTGTDHADELERLRRAAKADAQVHDTLHERWTQERELVARVRAIRGAIEDSGDQAEDAESGGGEGATSCVEDLEQATAELKAVQGDAPLLDVCVDAQAVARVVATWTGIPVRRMVADEAQGVLELESRMRLRVIGQDHALRVIARSIVTSRANLADPGRPVGVFLLAGTSGVGKTETALTLASLLFGGEQSMTVINMSEFKEEHKVSLLMGSPPGYVGYGEGGVLTEAVRRKPYSVILLDEMEKAHQGVQDVFYQVFDKGNMKDGEGRDIDFKNAVVIMTTNAGTETLKALYEDPETVPDPDALEDAIRPELLKHFKPAFLGRVNVLPYVPLSDANMREIIRLKLAKVAERVRGSYGAHLEVDEAVFDTMLARCGEVDSGARNVDQILNRTILPELAAQILDVVGGGWTAQEVRIGASDAGFSYRVLRT